MIKGSLYYYYHYDGLGSVKAITDSSGNVIESYTYDVYGKPTIYNTIGKEIPESQVGNSFLFTGKMFDYDTGLYYYRNRYYDPELGRFITPDPLGPVGLVNDDPKPDMYVNNNPLNLINPESVRLIAPDPTAHIDGLNLYTYVGNNPVNRTDPYGLCWGKAHYDWVRRELFARELGEELFYEIIEKVWGDIFDRDEWNPF